MKVKATEDFLHYLTKNKEYEVINEEDDLYYIKNDTGFVGGIFKHRFEVVTDSNFRIRDKVYHHICGWATVKEIKNDMCFLHDVNNAVVCFPCRELSLTEYTLQGFSQVRPIEFPAIGEVCLFSDDDISWKIGEFNGYGSLDYPFGTFDLGDFKYCKRVKFL